MTDVAYSMNCQRCGTPMELRDPAPGAAWAPQQFWVCPRCGRHFWTTYPTATPKKDEAPAATATAKKDEASAAAPKSAARPVPPAAPARPAASAPSAPPAKQEEAPSAPAPSAP